MNHSVLLLPISPTVSSPVKTVAIIFKVRSVGIAMTVAIIIIMIMFPP